MSTFNSLIEPGYSYAGKTKFYWGIRIDPKTSGRKLKEEFTGKNLPHFEGARLMRQFLGKLKLDQHIRNLGTSKRREEDYSPSEVCYGILYALMISVYSPTT